MVKIKPLFAIKKHFTTYCTEGYKFSMNYGVWCMNVK